MKGSVHEDYLYIVRNALVLRVFKIASQFLQLLKAVSFKILPC